MSRHISPLRPNAHPGFKVCFVETNGTVSGLLFRGRGGDYAGTICSWVLGKFVDMGRDGFGQVGRHEQQRDDADFKVLFCFCLVLEWKIQGIPSLQEKKSDPS
jgi:hypothetical protein